MNLQLSGDVSDDSAQAIGKQLGAQAIVTGSLTNLGNTYRFRVKVINVETARIEAQFSYNLGNNQQVAFLLNGNQQNDPPVNSTQGQNAPRSPQTTQGEIVPSSQTTKTYKIGDTGPAGGLIFYDKGNNSDGWRYLEAATQDGGKAQWGPLRIILGGTDTKVGSGKRNTDVIMYYLRNAGESAKAAQVAMQYTQGGYTDWFLPSKDELDLMYRNLRQELRGDFSMGDYWSSSESNDSSWRQRFSDGKQDGNYSYGRDQTYCVRSVRVF
jgi:hypothetical protein